MVARSPLFDDVPPQRPVLPPSYVVCPQCEHPAVLRRSVPGQLFRCRQCNASYTIRGQKKSGLPVSPTRERRREPSDQ